MPSFCPMKTKTMIFRPRRKTVACLGLACLAAAVLAGCIAVRVGAVIIHLGAAVTGVLSVVLLGPVLRNQTIEVGEASVLVRTFARAVELRPQHLTQVVRRKSGIVSYRFESGRRLYQVTPIVYHDAALLQAEFDRLFDSQAG